MSSVKTAAGKGLKGAAVVGGAFDVVNLVTGNPEEALVGAILDGGIYACGSALDEEDGAKPKVF